MPHYTRRGEEVFHIDLKSRKAIYEQVVDNFKRLITTGALREHDKAPSIRDLARTLDVNPNTVQKAYRELETQGYFYTVLGQGNFIASPAKNDDKAVKTRLNAIKELVRELMYHGVSKEEILKFIETEGED
jgi:GntR family transcriptional regulator